jgi:hypothetical protein
MRKYPGKTLTGPIISVPRVYEPAENWNRKIGKIKKGWGTKYPHSS